MNKFGIKGGLILSKISLSEFDSEIFLNEPTGKYKFLSADVGLFVELLDSRYLCISAELHYIIRGEDDEKYFTVLLPDTVNFTQNFEDKNLNNRFHYLSLQILPRWKYVVNSEDKLYLFAGPRFDLRLSNSNSFTESAIKFNNTKLEFGFTVGIGNEFWDLFSFELRYEHNLTNAYTFTSGDQTFNRKHNSFLLLFGLSLKKLLRINL